MKKMKKKENMIKWKKNEKIKKIYKYNENMKNIINFHYQINPLLRYSQEKK